MPTSLNKDLIAMRKAKRISVELGQRKTEAERVFKDRQRRALERMAREEVESMKVAGTLFSPVEKQYATVEDRSEFVRWALTESAPIMAFIHDWASDVVDGTESPHACLAELIQAIEETPFIRLKEHADPLNALVRECLDDGAPLPPGVSFRTDTYISQRSA